MNWLNRLLNTIFPNRAIHQAIQATQNETPKGPFDEEREAFYDLDIESRLPRGHRAVFVKRCRSNFYFDPDCWERGEVEVRWTRNRYAIEIEDASGEVVAAVGWVLHDETPDVAKTFGTMVKKKLRRRGLAKALWRAMIRTCGRPKVRGCAVTDEGFTLLKSMSETFPGIVSFNADADYRLTDLREKQGVA